MSTNKEVSTMQEQQVARWLDGEVVPQSGGGKFDKGDVVTDHLLFECKTVAKPRKSFSIKERWLEKASEQAFEMGKYEWALAFRFEPEGRDYYIIGKDTMLLAKDLIEDYYKTIEDVL